MMKSCLDLNISSEQSIFLSTKLRLNLSHIFNQRQIFFAHAWLGSVTLNFRTEPCIKGVNGAKMFPWRGKFSAKASETFFTAICLFHHSKNWAEPCKMPTFKM